MSYEPGTSSAQYSSGPFTPEQEARIVQLVRDTVYGLGPHLPLVPDSPLRLEVVIDGQLATVRPLTRSTQSPDPAPKTTP